MKAVWILVLGRTGARIFERLGDERKVHFVLEVLHPEGRLKEGELVTDRAGREFDPVSKVSHAGGHPGEARTHSDQLFLKEVADRLRKLKSEGKFSRLYLVSDPHLLGMLRPHLDDEIVKMIVGTVKKDLSRVVEADLFPALSGSLVP
ncbi:MAG: host attachment protein [Nitrospirota bacterium]|nr:host attachment protein [Nitrospirota bacterium]